MVGLDADAHRDEDCDVIGLGCALEHFSEAEDVLSMIDNVKNIYNTHAFEVENEKLYNILKQYYEQPHLLDPHLDKILSRLLTVIKDKELPFELKHAVFHYMYQIIRVRGYKVVVRHLPHEVSDLLTVLSYLEAQDPNDKDTWRSRYVLLLWLSIVVIIPFDMSRLDGFVPTPLDPSSSSERLTVKERILKMCKTYALCKDSCAEAGAYLTSKFLIRADVKEPHLGEFLRWACEQAAGAAAGAGGGAYGALAAAAGVLKRGKRLDLLPHAAPLLRRLAAAGAAAHPAMLVRKYTIKIVQRIGLTFLRPRVVAWRYARGARSLALGGAPADPAPADGADGGDGDDGAADDDDIPPEVEEVAETLLAALRDTDTVVRWSAAKGAGRLGARLPPAAAADVADGALALFAPTEPESAWHGGCMALAELARRGLLAPRQLGAVVDAVVAALRRDEPRAGGGGGGGRAARDAACHAAWALARAYDAAALRPHAARLAPALLAAAALDREVAVRRAASAAFQEHVGRHGLFPRGIDALTAADFQAVGSRAHSYLVVAPRLAALAPYAEPLAAHLLQLKVPHWDAAVRALAAQALARITPQIPEYVATTAWPVLVDGAESTDLNTRHGAILALGETARALAACGRAPADTLWARVRALPGGLRARRLLRGLGGELTRQALGAAAAALGAARAPLHAGLDDWLLLVEESAAHDAAPVRDEAARALPRLVDAYLGGADGAGRRDALLTRLCERLADEGAAGLSARMGAAAALAGLAPAAAAARLDDVLAALAACTRVTPATERWAEARRDAAGALAALAPPGPRLARAADALLAALAEYTVDARGDVGAWVREAAAAGLAALLRRDAEHPPSALAPAQVAAAAAGLARQAVEKIDRTRALAARLFTELLHAAPAVAHVPRRADLAPAFPPEGGAAAWLSAAHTMPRFVRLLAYAEYRGAVTRGLVASAGDTSDGLVRHTVGALAAWLVGEGAPHAAAVAAEALAAARERRLLAPALRCLERLAAAGALAPLLADEAGGVAGAALALAARAARGRSVYRALEAGALLGQLVAARGAAGAGARAALAALLARPEPHVRRVCAARLYEALALYGDEALPAARLEPALQLLADTDWERDYAAAHRRLLELVAPP